MVGSNDDVCVDRGLGYFSLCDCICAAQTEVLNCGGENLSRGGMDGVWG